MKKWIVISISAVIVVVLASCGKEEATKEVKTKTCEQIESCKTALEYVTYNNQEAYDKVYAMELDEEGAKSFGSPEEAKANVPEDIKQVKDQKVEKYEALEYEISPNKKYIYKFRFQDLRTKKSTNLTIRLEKQSDGSYKVFQYYKPVPNSDITVGGEIVNYKRYYAKGLTEQEKGELKPSPIEQ